MSVWTPKDRGRIAWVRGVLAWGTVVVSMVLGAPAFAQSADAEAASSPRSSAPPTRPPRDAIRVYQQRVMLRALRVEVTPTGGISLNDPLTLHYSAGIGMNVFINEEWSVGGSYHKYFRHELPTGEEITDSFGIYAERRPRDFHAGGHVTWVPLYGKFVLFQTGILHFDTYLIGGGGVMRTFSPGLDGELRPSWNLGIGSRLYLTGAVALTFEFRNFMYLEEFASIGKSFQNDVVLQAGLSIFFPPTVTYRFPK